jgi:hypothetical protein
MNIKPTLVNRVLMFLSAASAFGSVFVPDDHGKMGLFLCAILAVLWAAVEVEPRP